MNILLAAVNAKYIHSNLAVYALKASAGGPDSPAAISEFTINQDPDMILSELVRKKPDVLCFSVYIWNLETVEKIAESFHILCPSVPVWVGGPEVSFESEAFLRQHEWAFGVMIGEGEETFRELCAYYCNPASHGGLSSVYGIIFRTGTDSFCRTKPRKAIDLDQAPFPYDTTEDFANRIIYYESMRGCPFSCSYCLSSVDKVLRFRSLEKVFKELSFFLNRRVQQVKFVDRTFNCDRERSLSIWKYLSENDNGVTGFHFEIAADLLRDEDISFLKTVRPGLIQLEIGVQSANPESISAIRRTMSLDKVGRAVAEIKSAGNILQHLDLIAGLPFEDYESFHRSFNTVYAWKPEELQLGFLKVLKGTEMYRMADEYLCRYRPYPPYEVLSTRWLPYEDICRLKRVEEMLEVYYNSGQFPVTVRILEMLFNDAFAAFQRLGDYYLEKGLLGFNYSRERRCTILMDFAFRELEGRPDCDEWKELLREASVFDLYARENCKTRPAWAPDPKLFREKTHKYCLNGKLSHIEPFHYRFPASFRTESAELPVRESGTVWAYFDYTKRDPLSHQALIQYPDIPEE